MRGIRCKLWELPQISSFNLIGHTSADMEPTRWADDDSEAPSSSGLSHNQPPSSSANRTEEDLTTASAQLGWRLVEVLDARCCACCSDI